MGKIIAFGNQKGGTGKSTCTTLAANGLSQAPYNFRVAVIDTDKQKSLTRARLFDSEDHTGTFPYDVLNYNVPTFEAKAAELIGQNDFIFVDAAGKLDRDLPTQHQEISRIVTLLDYLFIPFVAGNYSLEATLDYLKFVLQEQALRGPDARQLEIIGFVNMDRERTRNRRYLLSEIDDVKRMAGIPFMKSSLKDYTLYKDVDTLETFYDESPTDPARLNYTIWLKELAQILTT